VLEERALTRPCSQDIPDVLDDPFWPDHASAPNSRSLGHTAQQ
jgi:hypothetical protein